MADDPKRPQNPNIPIQASARTQRGFYSNLARVTHSPEEFVLDFLFLHHDPPFGRLGARVLLSPAHMKRLAAALQENVSRYETRFGVIQEHPGPDMPGGDELTAKSSPQERAASVLAALRRLFPVANCALTHANPFQLLAATILSAQCTDVMVNKVTPALFAKYPDASALAAADPADLEKLIHSTGFYRNKAKNLIGMARTLRDHFKGEVPRTMDELLTLPGVARKTANVVLGSGFGIAEGIVVDTHVIRLSGRLGLTRHKTPEKIERALVKMFPRDSWIFLSHALILHGRSLCSARAPKCGDCPMNSFCPAAQI